MLTAFVIAQTKATNGSEVNGVETSAIVAGVFAAVVLLFAFIFAFRFGNLYMMALFSNAPVSVTELIGMRLRKVDPWLVVYSKIRLAKAGLNMPTENLETHVLAGGQLPRVVNAMVIAKNAGLSASWVKLTASDLRGQDVEAEMRALVSAKGGKPAVVSGTADWVPTSVLIGLSGLVIEGLAPRGRVAIGGKDFAAQSDEAPIEFGCTVEVCGFVDDILLVRRVR